LAAKLPTDRCCSAYQAIIEWNCRTDGATNRSDDRIVKPRHTAHKKDFKHRSGKSGAGRKSMTTASNVVRAESTSGLRWSFLAICVICMIMIANLQYGWTLFVNPINKAHGWSITSIQFAFSIFIALETWLTPIQGWIVDILGPQRGPKLMVAFGGITVAIGWVINAYAQSLEMLYLGAIVSGTGGGAVYATCVGNAVKWFPDRRGLAVGLTAAGYGAGAALTVIPIRYAIDNYGYNTAFLWFGIVRTNDGDCVRAWRHILLAAGSTRNGTVGLRAVRRTDLPHLGRDLQPVSVNLHGYVWTEICNRELEPPLHRQRHVGFPCSYCEYRQVVGRKLAHGVHSHRGYEFHRGGTCLVRAQADAPTPTRKGLIRRGDFLDAKSVSDGLSRSPPTDRL
jgi:hypothetical protein